MEYSSVWAIWAVAIAGPCVISWLAGDIAGSARTRQLYGEMSLPPEKGEMDQQSYRPTLVEEWRVSGVTHPLAEAVEGANEAALCPPTYMEQAAQAECRRMQRAAICKPRRPIRRDWGQATASLPPRATWTRPEDQTPDQVLRQYALSVSDLHLTRAASLNQSAQRHFDEIQIVDEREVWATRPA